MGESRLHHAGYLKYTNVSNRESNNYTTCMNVYSTHIVHCIWMYSILLHECCHTIVRVHVGSVHVHVCVCDDIVHLAEIYAISILAFIA